MRVREINKIIRRSVKNTNHISDGCHNFGELYSFREKYNALLFNEWALQGKYEVSKSRKHHDGTSCFDGKYFIVTAMLPDGMISNHYKNSSWKKFKIPAFARSPHIYDGHTSQEVIRRLNNIIKNHTL